MGWGIDFKSDVYIHKEDYQENKHQVKDAIEEVNDNILNCHKEIQMYAASTPKDITPDTFKDEIISFINTEISDILYALNDYYNKLFKLELYLEYLECKDAVKTKEK